MPDEYGTITSDDPRTGLPTYQQLQARRAIALSLAERARPYPKTIGEGLTALGEGLGENYANQRLAGAEAAQQVRDAKARSEIYPDTPAAPAKVSLADDPAMQASASVAAAASDNQPVTPAQAAAQPSMSIDEWKQRVARNESGAEKSPYTAVGEESRSGDFPYGKYQVMGENIPKWTQQYLGRKMTPQEFLADKDAQEQVATAKGNEYITKYGPVGAAQAWFAGPNWRKDPRATDVLGTNVAEYTRRFNSPFVTRDQIAASAASSPDGGAQPIQVASLGGGPTPDTAPDAADIVPNAGRDAAAQALLAQQMPAPPPGQGLPLAPPVGFGGAQGAQQQPLQQVAQAGPLPATPLAGPPVGSPAATSVMPRPQIAPSTAASLQAQPPPAGPEPKFADFMNDKDLKPQIDAARRNMGNPTLSPAMNALAEKRLGELHEIAKDNFTRAWTVWHEDKNKEDQFKLDAEARQRARETHTVTMQEAPYKLEQARKAAEPTTKEVEGRIMERDPDTGKWNDVTPGGTLPNLTENQSKILGYYQRAKWAVHNLGDGKELNDFAQWYESGMPAVGNYAVSAKFQRQLQAANEIAAVQLRLETGTAAPPAELKNVLDRLIPRPGDQPESLLQKQQLRDTLVKGYADQMGSKGQPYIDKFNREFELDKKEYDKKQNTLLPPIKITDPEQLDLVPSGRRWVAPDGRVKIKP